MYSIFIKKMMHSLDTVGVLTFRDTISEEQDAERLSTSVLLKVLDVSSHHVLKILDDLTIDKDKRSSHQGIGRSRLTLGPPGVAHQRRIGCSHR